VGSFALVKEQRQAGHLGMRLEFRSNPASRGATLWPALEDVLAGLSGDHKAQSKRTYGEGPPNRRTPRCW